MPRPFSSMHKPRRDVGCNCLGWQIPTFWLLVRRLLELMGTAWLGLPVQACSKATVSWLHLREIET